ncbi:MAG: hypothetical protein ACYCWN_06065 [Ferrimicrobium sp.]|uniref:Uncharacterized protein n=1 Tax=Ferrimicrobium acidiphilum TaxID=121039 RepID=A0ABV3Y2S1_9ACTN|nr:hypothetical protein [Ferrimicrobium sp.]MCL5972925.1 hypothetical protein [Actinomycetota bacterium]
MYPKQEQVQSVVDRAPFWAVLERTAARVDAEHPVKLPEVVEMPSGSAAPDEGDTRVVASDSQRPREVYARIRGLLADVEGDSTGLSYEQPASGDMPAVDATVVDDMAPTVSGEVEREPSPMSVQDDSYPDTQQTSVVETNPGDQVPTIDPVVHASEDQVMEVESQDDAPPRFEFGTHAAVIPGTEEFMSSLARKNRAFEHTGEIDTDLDRAADKLGWNRSDDDIVVKRKIFKKRK